MAVTQPVSDACDAPPAEAGDLIQSIALLADDRGGVRFRATGCNSDRLTKPSLYRSRRSGQRL